MLSNKKTDLQQPKEIQIISFTNSTYSNRLVQSDLFRKNFNEKEKHWINIYTDKNLDTINAIAELFGISQYYVNEIADKNSIPKCEINDSSIFFSTFYSKFNETQHIFEYHDISFYIGSNYIITFQDNSYHIFDEIRQHLEFNTNKIREKDIGYLFYRLFDNTVMKNYSILNKIESSYDFIEEKIYKQQNKVPNEIQKIKREIYQIKRKILALETASAALSNSEHIFFNEKTQYLLEQTQHRILHLNVLFENARNNASDLMNVYMSEMNNRMNNVMKILTAISSIFIPLNFIVGFYGMNFEYNMPFLHNKIGVLFISVFMLILVIAIVSIFKKRKWF